MAAQEVSGLWKRQNVGYSSAMVWGTGVNPVHYYYGSDPLRTTEYPVRQGEITPPFQSIPEDLTGEQNLWGYTHENSLYTNLEIDARPRWGECTYDETTRASTGQQPPWSAPQRVNETFRSRFGGAFRTFRGAMTLAPGNAGDLSRGYEEPSETVTEGWRNKPKGSPADSKPSDDSQLIVQTSMKQRYQVRNNRNAVSRGADEPRAGIPSRVIGQKLKKYSGGERHYDMTPREQDDIPRPFWFRHAGTGRVDEMLPNTMWSISALQRIPPADPSMGIPETDLGDSFGYSTEDAQYYGG